MTELHDPRRRTLLATLGLLAAGVADAGAIHDDEPGLVRPPRAVPDLAVTLEDGRAATLRALLTGRVTALQFVLTTCSSSCPLLGAIFGQIQRQLAIDRATDLQLVSLSLDPLGDTPAALMRWMRRFDAGPNWHAALPKVEQSALVETLLGLGVDGSTDRDRHASSMLVFDRQARLVYRSENFPDARFMGQVLMRLAA